jgi:hypothetical protein
MKTASGALFFGFLTAYSLCTTQAAKAETQNLIWVNPATQTKWALLEGDSNGGAMGAMEDCRDNGLDMPYAGEINAQWDEMADTTLGQRIQRNGVFYVMVSWTPPTPDIRNAEFVDYYNKVIQFGTYGAVSPATYRICMSRP